jgi:hypothetical protein
MELNLLAEFTKSCKRRPLFIDLKNLAHTADDLMVQDLYRSVISRRRSAGTAEFYQCTVQFCTVQSYYGPGPVPYSHKPAQAGFGMSQILARSS